jgi:NADH-ubiquinone oxidoreductase chain 1
MTQVHTTPFYPFLLLIVLVLVGVAFLVLLERRVLGYVHIRKGPNRVDFIGLFQPFRDAVRLFIREAVFSLMLFFRLRLGLPNGLFPSGFPTKILYALCVGSYCTYVKPADVAKAVCGPLMHIGR